MAQQTINVGTVGNDNTGDPNRTAFQKTNANFTELYALVAALNPNITGTLAVTGPGPDTGSFTGSIGADTTTGLVAHWPMNEGTGTTLSDASGNGYTATLTNITGGYWSGGAGTGLLTLNEADYATAPDSAAWDITPNLTVFGWIRGNIRSGEMIAISRFDFGAAARSWALGFSPSSSVIHVLVSPDGGGIASTGKDYTGSQTVLDATGTWRSIAFRFAAGTLDLFVNGIKDTAVNKTAADNTMAGIFASSSPIGIGIMGQSSSAVNPLFGDIAAFRIYNVAKTDADIAAIHALGH